MIPISKPHISDSDIDTVHDAMKSGWVSSIGQYVTEFEANFAKYCGVKYAIACSNGTTALHLALMASGIGVGDDVIVPDLTFVATANAVKYTGANIILVDVNEKNLCIDIDDIRKKITDNTKAIIPVHLYGHPADMHQIEKIAKGNNIVVIEDAAEAHGAEILGRKVGSFGDSAIFSFYGNKVITTGEGGMLVTDNADIYEKAKYLSNHAMSETNRYWHNELGYNYRMTNIQAALGVSQLRRINEIIERKNDIFKIYYRELSSLNDIILNHTDKNVKNVFWQVNIECSWFNRSIRDEFINKLYLDGVDTRPYFFPVSTLPMYSSADNPVSKKLSERGLSLPSYFTITEEEIIFISNAVNENLIALKRKHKSVWSN